MDSDISYFILNKIQLSKDEFVNSICQRNYPYLFQYLDICAYMSKSKNKFTFIKEDWDYNFFKKNFKGLSKAVEDRDYEIGKHEVEIEVDNKKEMVEIDVEKYTIDFIQNCMTYECINAIEHIKYIKNKYKEYVEEFKYMNM